MGKLLLSLHLFFEIVELAMDTEEQKRKILSAIFTAFDKWAAQNFDVLFDPETRKNNPELFEREHFDDIFMLRRVTEIGLFRYVAQQVMESEDCKRQLTNDHESCPPVHSPPKRIC